MCGQDLSRAYRKMSHLVQVLTPGQSKKEDVIRVRENDPRALLEVSFLHNQVVHVFAREAILYTAMHASSQGKAGITERRVNMEGGWVERSECMPWWEFIRELLLSDAVHVHDQGVSQVVLCVPGFILSEQVALIEEFLVFRRISILWLASFRIGALLMFPRAVPFALGKHWALEQLL